MIPHQSYSPDACELLSPEYEPKNTSISVRFYGIKWREIFFVSVREFFTSRAKMKKISREFFKIVEWLFPYIWFVKSDWWQYDDVRLTLFPPSIGEPVSDFYR